MAGGNLWAASRGLGWRIDWVRRGLCVGLLVLVAPGAHAGDAAGVVATIPPLHSLVSGVMGDTGSAELLLPGRHSPHGFQLKPSQLRALREARVVFYIDDSFESYLPRAFAVLPRQLLRMAVARTPGLAVLGVRRAGVWQARHYDVRERKTAPGAGGGGPGRRDDMHIWLDPGNAAKIADFMAGELGRLYPRHRAAYRGNARVLVRRLEALDAELAAELAPFRERPFAVFHDAYQYFERRYGLNGVGAMLPSPDAAPSAGRLRELRARLAQSGAVCVLREPQVSDRLVRTVIEGTGAGIGVADPLGAGLPPGPELYFVLLRQLAADLRRCLQ